MQEFFNLTHHKYSDDNRDHMSLIANHRNLPQAKDVEISVNAAGHRPRILQVRMHHNHTDNTAEEWISAEYLSSRETDQYRQEDICGIGEHVCQYIQCAVCGNIEIAVVNHKRQGFHNPHQEAGCYDRRNDRNENIT